MLSTAPVEVSVFTLTLPRSGKCFTVDSSPTCDAVATSAAVKDFSAYDTY